MTDAQIGLMVATPAIIGFSLVLYRMGALQGAGTLSAVAASIVIAAVLSSVSRSGRQSHGSIVSFARGRCQSS